jgi:hypothetical protein
MKISLRLTGILIIRLYYLPLYCVFPYSLVVQATIIAKATNSRQQGVLARQMGAAVVMEAAN